MLEWIISSAVLLAAVIAVRYALRGRLRPGVQYAMWAIAGAVAGAGELRQRSLQRRDRRCGAGADACGAGGADAVYGL